MIEVNTEDARRFVIIEVLPIDTPSLGDRSYLATDGTVGIVVDPQRDFDRILDLAAERGIRITHVVETHIHNDYVTGGLALARETGADYLVGADDPVTFERTPARDGDVIAAGEMRLRVMHTPGHTFTHLSYALADAAGTPVGVFTGGSLLFRFHRPANAAGPAAAPDLSPPQIAEAAELRRRIDAGEWVVDLRERVAFAAGHVPGTYNFGYDGKFVTYLGWLIPWGTPITLLGESADQVAAAQRDLVRIGIDRPAAAATGTPTEWAGGGPLASYQRATFADLAAEQRAGKRPYVLDVRRDDERRAGGIDSSMHIPLHRLAGRLADVPDERPVWVHCASGYRASIAAAMLARQGYRVVLIDDDLSQADSAGVAFTAKAA